MSVQSLIMFVVYLIIAGVIFWLLQWLVDYVGIPEPFHKVLKVVIAVVAVLIVIFALLNLAGISAVHM